MISSLEKKIQRREWGSFIKIVVSRTEKDGLRFYEDAHCSASIYNISPQKLYKRSRLGKCYEDHWWFRFVIRTIRRNLGIAMIDGSDRIRALAKIVTEEEGLK